MKFNAKNTILAAILWLGVQKVFGILSHYVKQLDNFEESQKLAFEVVTLAIALFLVYHKC